MTRSGPGGRPRTASTGARITDARGPRASYGGRWRGARTGRCGRMRGRRRCTRRGITPRGSTAGSNGSGLRSAWTRTAAPRGARPPTPSGGRKGGGTSWASTSCWVWTSRPAAARSKLPSARPRSSTTLTWPTRWNPKRSLPRFRPRTTCCVTRRSAGSTTAGCSSCESPGAREATFVRHVEVEGNAPHNAEGCWSMCLGRYVLNVSFTPDDVASCS
mmetsp:Transcript_68044/g.215244  ORF Transcript_68044/g.215244 Transcript_68044/m.215244 type:complete len:217 (+) Transcript_68044:621-1271(+)